MNSVENAKVSYSEAQAERRALNAKLKQIVFAVYGCKCAVCGYTNKPGFAVSRDLFLSGKLKANGNAIHHIEPVHLGGKTVFDNLILLCPTHHKEAHDGIIDCEDYVIRGSTAALNLCNLTPTEEHINTILRKSIKKPVERYTRKFTAKPTYNWIKTSENLPKKGEIVLIYHESNTEQGIRLSEWSGADFMRNPYFAYKFENVGYWVPLPESERYSIKRLPVEGEEVLIWYRYPFESKANVKLLKWTKDNQYSDFITGWIPLPTPPVDYQFMTDEDKYHAMEKFFEARPKLLETCLLYNKE